MLGEAEHRCSIRSRQVLSDLKFCECARLAYDTLCANRCSHLLFYSLATTLSTSAYNVEEKVKKLGQKGYIDQLLIIAIVLMLAVGGFILWQLQDAGDEEVATTETQAPIESEPINETSMPAEEQVERTRVATAELTAVNGYIASGSAERWSADMLYMHEVIAELPELPAGKFYEGWLVGETVVSTGRLENELPGEWSLVYSSEEDLFNHNQIVITEETEANGLDGIPEIHVLEGSF